MGLRNLDDFKFILLDYDLIFLYNKYSNQGIYHPHATLATGEDITLAKEITNCKFEPFEATVQQLSIYNRRKQLIKKYDLKPIPNIHES